MGSEMCIRDRGREVARLQGEAKWDGPEAKAMIKQVIEAIDTAAAS